MTKTSTVEKTCFKALWKGRQAERGGCEIILADQTRTEENGLCSQPFHIASFQRLLSRCV